VTKSFVLYTILEVEGNLVNCVYLINGQCWAQPFATHMHGGPAIELYKPTEDEQKRFCTNTGREGFRICPRAGLYHEYLRAKGLEKPE
jgi:hypothetical protein